MLKSKFIFYYLFLSNLILFTIQSKAQKINHWELIVNASDTWKYYIGTSEPPSSWSDIGFDASTWSSGPGGIGYGENNQGTSIPATPETYCSLYIRNSFQIIDKTAISWGILYVDYDDGFVAYLNGHEIARANIGTNGIRPAFNQYANNSDHEAQLPTGGTPARFLINNDTISKYLVVGENILALQIHNCNNTSSDLSSTTFFITGITNTSSNYRNLPSWFVNPGSETSNLPLLVIDTYGQEIPDDPKIRAWLKVIDNGTGNTNSFIDPATDYNGYMGIEIRGQSSQMFPKKSFGIKLWSSDSSGVSASLLDMPSEEDWVLYAPYSDKSLLRNALTYHLGHRISGWNPRWRFVEVYLNGSYHGIYMLIEKIDRGSKRVDINKLKPDEISGDDLTGGYILKVDKVQDLTENIEYFYTHPNSFYKNARNYAFTYEYPDYDEIAPEQKNYIKTYLTDLENALNGQSFKDPENQ